jgi:hypothetical protein
LYDGAREGEEEVVCRQLVDYCPANGGGYDDPIAQSGRQFWSLAIVTETERARKIDRGQDSLLQLYRTIFLNNN